MPHTLHSYILSFGSNSPDKALMMERLRQWAAAFDGAELSAVYSTEPWSGHGAGYLNMVARVSSPLEPEQMQLAGKELERSLGRTPEKKSAGVVPADVDVMWCDGLILRPDEWLRPYFARGLAQLSKP